MKIVVFIENNQRGGLDTFCSSLINSWPDYQDQFVIISNASHPGIHSLCRAIERPCEFISHEIPLSWVLSRRLLGWLPGRMRRVVQPFLRILLFPIQMLALKRLFVGVDGDGLLVLNGGFPGGETCRIANIAWNLIYQKKGIVARCARNIHCFHNFAVPPRLGLSMYENSIDRLLRRSNCLLTSVSLACAKSLAVRASFARETCATYIHNGIEAVPIQRDQVLDLRSSLGIGEAPLCLVLANYEPRKGHRFLFEAFEQVSKSMPEVHLVVCGGGTEEEVSEVESLRKKIAPNCHIHLCDFVENGAALIDQADLLLIGSQAFESFGLSAVEAMARGVAVVATRVGGLQEVIGESGDGGYLVSPHEPQLFAERMLELLKDPDLRRAVGQRGQMRVTKFFTAVGMAKNYHRLIHEIPTYPVFFEKKLPRSEWYFLIRRLREPMMFLGLLRVTYSALIRRTQNRIFRGRRRYYPPLIRAVADTVVRQLGDVSIKHPVSFGFGPRRLALASGHLEFDGWPDWKREFEDHEQFVSVHRWNWLLRALTDEQDPPDFSWGVALMRSWLKAMSPLPAGDAGESYTVGERISNACLFARQTRGTWTELPADLVLALHKMAIDLSARIEYQDGGLSGNHVVNNARALLFAGHCVGSDELRVLGRSLLRDRLPVLITQDAFLREGSSHYQFLFTRWLLELRLLAEETGDRETLEILKPVVPLLVEGCKFFLVEGEDGSFMLPTIGDISPDCDPAWLLDLPHSPLSSFGQIVGSRRFLPRGWASLFSGALANSSENWRSVTASGSPWRSYQEAGWYRLDAFNWVAIWRAESSSGEAIASHAHHDSGSLVIFHKGREVLIDPGRRDYTDSKIARFGTAGAAHNVVLVNGRPALVSRGDRLLPNFYREAQCSINFCQHGQAVKVEFEHNGFSRLACGVQGHRREFFFTPQEIRINDHFEGKGMNRVESRFHFPLNATAGVSLLEAPGEFFEQKLRAASSPVGGWRFPSYGVEEHAITQSFRGEFKFPAVFRYRLSVDGT